MSEPYLEALEELKERERRMEAQLKRERSKFEDYMQGDEKPQEDSI